MGVQKALTKKLVTTSLSRFKIYQTLGAMIKQFKIMIFVNALLGFSFLVSNYIYYYFAVRFDGHGVIWTPLWLIFRNFQVPDDMGAVEPNFSFYFFWVLMIVNIYFLFRLQRSNQTK